MLDLAMFGSAAALGLAALGSALGTGAASQAAVGGWKKCFANDKPAPFMLVAFAGAPLTQTIYGFLLMLFISGSDKDPLGLLGIGIFGGLAMGLSAYMQGKAAARAADALAETGKGTANYFMVIGIVETVALFVMVFLLLLINA
ncbi:MAG: V-type ATP synthase subunit K [Candidatus Neomarinimicrobiota bacterium]|jgi:V/A-type H+-transporting ATPase subunit K|nr:V-type ATP synthase subunit K [Candidatus Neomarinimicrobiota bacterium]MDD3966482.1 V-type ATP synthase subunit K [Candidatus Neomarinimicrobiota bacterium]MDD4961282.1 V-type ATP synthase subunit K [Candidatus Neomarinimicrobiota bacterium]MDX9778472.1 V-type ATP synthase subunit K [bacterium]